MREKHFPTLSPNVILYIFSLFPHPPTYRPVAAISWRKDGSPLNSSDHISFSQAARNLTISSVGSEDAGSYLCVATVPSTGASIESPAASLSVIGGSLSLSSPSLSLTHTLSLLFFLPSETFV